MKRMNKFITLLRPLLFLEKAFLSSPPSLDPSPQRGRTIALSRPRISDPNRAPDFGNFSEAKLFPITIISGPDFRIQFQEASYS